MSTRQNKKRKARNNTNRERTVTTLTEDPNTQYLVPTPSEEPAQPFPSSGPVGVQIHTMSSMGSKPYGGKFPYGYPPTFPPAQHTNMQQPYYPTSPQQAQPKSNLPPGKNDLEILQNLKKMIIEGQHPFYRAAPSPTALANLYMGPIQSQTEASDQHVPGLGVHTKERKGIQRRVTIPTGRSVTGKVGTVPEPDKNAPASPVTNLGLGALQISPNGTGPSSAGVKSGAPAPEDHSVAMEVDRPANGGDETKARAPPAADHGVTALPDDRDLTARRDATQPVAAASVPPSGSVESLERRPSAPGGSEKKVFPAGREWYPNNHEHRVVYERPGDVRPTESRRPAPHSVPHPIKTEVRPASLSQPATGNSAQLDARPEARSSVSVDAPQLSVHASAKPTSSRDSVAVLPVVAPQAPPHHLAEHPSSDMEDVRSSRSPSPQPEEAGEVLSVIPVTTPVENAPPVVDSALPPLTERVDSSPAAPRQVKPTPEIIPASEQAAAPANQQDRFGRKNKFQKPHNFNGPAKFARQGAPGDALSPGSAGHAPRTFRPRSPSLDGRMTRDYRGPVPPPPPPPQPVRDRPPPAAYRAEYDPRRPDIIDSGVPIAARYDTRPYPDFSPAPLGQRRPSAYPSSPPPMSGGRTPPGDAPHGRPDYYMYPQGRSDWEVEDDDYYKSRGWDRPPPSAERERFERESYSHRPIPWDDRPDRDFIPRDAYSPVAPMPQDDRYAAEHLGRGRPPPAAYPPYGSRVRPRSPSPVGRPLSTLDDPRPPMKRAREEFPPEYYVNARPPQRRPSLSEYAPPRSGGMGPGPDWAAPMPGRPGSSAPPPRGREYRPPGREQPMDYGGPPPYDRGPQGPPGRMAYGPPGGYPPRPPQ